MPRRRPHRSRIVLSLVAIAAMTTLLAGCARGYRFNPTPKQVTVSGNDARILNRWATVWDTTLRAFWNDVGRTLYQDRPTRLTEEPSPW